MVPGMPLRNSSPASPADRASSATVRSSAPAPGDNPIGIDPHPGEFAAQPDDDAGESAVADQQVRRDAQRHDRDIARAGGQERRQILDIGRAEQNLGRAADAEPGQRRQRDRAAQAATHLR